MSEGETGKEGDGTCAEPEATLMHRTRKEVHKVKVAPDTSAWESSANRSKWGSLKEHKKEKTALCFAIKIQVWQVT